MHRAEFVTNLMGREGAEVRDVELLHVHQQPRLAPVQYQVHLVYMYMYVYIYDIIIYIISLSLSMCVCVYVYVYIYIYICAYI